MHTISYTEFMRTRPTLLSSCHNCLCQNVLFFENIKGEGFPVIACIDKVAIETDFYDTLDFGTMSEYNPVLKENGTVCCEFDVYN